MSSNLESPPQSWNPWSFIPEYYNLGQALTSAQVAAGRGDKVAIFWENAAGARRTLTYRELDTMSTRFASSLSRMGVQLGDRVFLRLPNIPEFYVAALGVAKLGAVFIPSSTQFRASEVEYRLQDSGAVAVITTATLVAAVDEVAGRCPQLKHVFVVNSESSPASRGSFEHLVQEGNESFSPARTRHDDMAFIAYTSGTTGNPKGVVHYQRYPIAYESLIRLWHAYQPDDIVACPAELGWLLPVASTFLYTLSNGLSVVLFDAQGNRFDAEKWFELFARYGITNFTATPTIYRMMMASASATPGLRDRLSRWRHAVSAGEPLPADTLEGIKQHFGIVPSDGIGMSECMVYCFNQIGRPVRPGSCGHPGPGTVMEVLTEDLQPVPVGEEGVLCIRRDSHPGMMKEYWNKPDQTAEIFRGDWYYSGDVVRRDESGFYWFQGRNDDVMKASGYRISPFEVESCLVSHPAVLEAAAVESPDNLRGMVVKAFVILRTGHTASESLIAEIQNFAKQQMAPYKCPRKIEFVATLPKTTSGKIKRRELREGEKNRDS